MNRFNGHRQPPFAAIPDGGLDLAALAKQRQQEELRKKQEEVAKIVWEFDGHPFPILTIENLFLLNEAKKARNGDKDSQALLNTYGYKITAKDGRRYWPMEEDEPICEDALAQEKAADNRA